MSINEKQTQTNINIQQKSALIWDVATQIVGLFKPHEYGKVILPMTVIKRFDDALKATKDKVVEMNQKLIKDKVADALRHTILCKTAGFEFYNTSKFNFNKLISDPDNIESNFKDYLQGFSENVKDIIENFDFTSQVDKLSKGSKLFIVIESFTSEKADMSPEKITSQDMGYIFEDLIRKFSESYNEEAGAHFTSRDIIYLMTELLIAKDKEEIRVNGCSKTAYDMAMGTSQMLGSLTEKVQEINPEANITSFGQEFNPETYAIAKADMLIKGGNASGMKFGDTLNNDQFPNYQFDYIISNPPFGIDWKSEKDAVEKEYKLGYEGRFGPGLPSISDGQMLFLLNGIKKLKDKGRMAIIQNGSSLFNGDAGSGPSEIRKYIIENDLLEAVIQLPTDLFYNTGIATYVWLISKDKSSERLGKVQLINASECYVKRRKNIGLKKVDLDDESIKLILGGYKNFKDDEYNKNQLKVESKVFDNAFFGYTKVVVETPLLDERGKPILKKGQPQSDNSLRDSEIVPLNEEIEKFFTENVKPYSPNARMDRTKDKIGYEIPFTRIFYKFIAPNSSKEIFNEIKKLEAEETALMKELFNND
jgi:type I restriction enzyme M protein